MAKSKYDFEKLAKTPDDVNTLHRLYKVHVKRVRTEKNRSHRALLRAQSAGVTNPAMLRDVPALELKFQSCVDEENEIKLRWAETQNRAWVYALDHAGDTIPRMKAVSTEAPNWGGSSMFWPAMSRTSWTRSTTIPVLNWRPA